MPMNELLYSRMVSKFGEVRIANEGEEMIVTFVDDYEHPGRVKMKIRQWGECYKVSCCFCTDTRFRLSISYMFGIYNERTGTYNLDLAHCYNTDGNPRDCLHTPGRREELERQLYYYTNPGDRKITSLRPPSKVTAELGPVDWPGDVIPIDNLYRTHHARMYLQERGFDPDTLSKDFDLQYCTKAKDAYPLAYNRIVIPIRMRSELVGWQCRYIGDLNWKETGIPKYYSLPGMPKRKMLYNFDQAKDKPVLVIVEGPSDVWRVGPWAVGLMGKSLTSDHMKDIPTIWRNSAVVVMLDPNAKEESKAICEKLNQYFPNRLIEVHLPEGTDPGSTSQISLWQQISSSADKAGINIAKFFYGS